MKDEGGRRKAEGEEGNAKGVKVTQRRIKILKRKGRQSAKECANLEY